MWLSTIEFVTASGILTAKKVPEIKKANASADLNGEAQDSCLIELNFPFVATVECNDVDLALVSRALGGADIVAVRRIILTDDIFVVLPSGKAVTELQPQLDEMLKWPGRGSCLCLCKLCHNTLLEQKARTASPRSGILDIHLDEHSQRVLLRGKAVD
ncbi:hypothetical protein Tsubulata_001185, partial [Turnera subulata]